MLPSDRSWRGRLAIVLSLAAGAVAACAPRPAAVARPATPPAEAAVPTVVARPAPSGFRPARAPGRIREADAYTRYELLAPGSGRFRILYEVTAIDPGATVYFNPIRKGSVVSDEAVYDRATGKALAFDVVPGAEAQAGGLPEADPETHYLRVRLPRPVPGEGGVRLRIDKTYTDAESYAVEGERGIVFDRPLGVRRNAVVLPQDYEVVSCNLPVQVLREADGRLALSFLHTGPDAAPLVIRARRLGR